MKSPPPLAVRCHRTLASPYRRATGRGDAARCPFTAAYNAPHPGMCAATLERNVLIFGRVELDRRYWSGYTGLLLSREYLSHDTTYFRMSARAFESMLWRGSNIRVKVIGGIRTTLSGA